MSKIKYLMEKIFVGFVLSLLVAFNVFTFILGPEPSTAMLVVAITFTTFILCIIFAILWRLGHHGS